MISKHLKSFNVNVLKISCLSKQAKDQMLKEKDVKVRALLQELLENLNRHLKKNEFHGHYFDRTSSDPDKMCDVDGWFGCEGPFDENQCFHGHRINPYASKVYRLLFSMWNLDHM